MAAQHRERASLLSSYRDQSETAIAGEMHVCILSLGGTAAPR
jgi:hypothetical protein